MFCIIEESVTFNSGARIGLIKKGGPEPRLVVSITDDTAQALPWPDRQTLSLKIGKNDCQGKLRIEPAPDGFSYARHSMGAKVDFGVVPTLGNAPKSSKQTQATVIIDAVARLELNLPTWEEKLPNFNKRIKRAEKPFMGNKGIMVFTDPPHLEYNGVYIDLYEFQAILLGPLVQKPGVEFDPQDVIDQGYAFMERKPHAALSGIFKSEMDKVSQKLRGAGLGIRTSDGKYSLQVQS
jgi:hypothetical protein